MRLIRQPNSWSCGPAAMAMALGLSLDEVIEAVGHDGSREVKDWLVPEGRAGFNEADLALASLRLGYAMTRLHTKPALPDGQLIEPWPPIQELFAKIDGPMVLVVKSERFESDHAVVIEGQYATEFYDPAFGVRPIEELPPVKFIEFFTPIGERGN